jgi:Flp pilus assembly protein CpaB
MLLGVLLALAAGTIVIYIVSQATTTTSQMVTVIMAKQQIKAGTILTVGPTDPTKNLLSITDAFVAKQVSADYAPADYQPFTTLDQLNVKLNNEVVIGTFYTGDILRTGDFTVRLAALGKGSPGSLTNINPAQLPQGSVLLFVETHTSSGASGQSGLAPGDHVDMVYVLCNLGQGAKDPNGCEAQTTVQDLYVYAVESNGIFVVVDHNTALQIVYLNHIGSGEILIRKPGDDGKVITEPADNATIVSAFHF